MAAPARRGDGDLAVPGEPDRNSPAVLALMGKGIDLASAKAISAKGITASRISKCGDSELGGLGLSTEVRRTIRERRPAIPTATVRKLLFECRWTCCVCRGVNQPIIIHHTSEWSVSKDHNITNLVVLCLNCHGRAHSTSTISQNLDQSSLRDAKRTWVSLCSKRDAETVFSSSSWGIMPGFWDYLNHSRIIDVASALNVNPMQGAGYQELLREGLIAADGSLCWPTPTLPDKNTLQYMYEGSRSVVHVRQQYYVSLLKEICKNSAFFDVSGAVSRKLAVRCSANMIIAVTGRHRFRNQTKIHFGPGQMRFGYYRAFGLQVEFSFDGWETTSSSSHGSHTSGSWRCTSILAVRSIEKQGKMFVASCTCLGLGTGFTEHQGHVPDIAYIKQAGDEEDEGDSE